ncbi:ComEA family DNA-binding protein, partial [bacterium]|nr:ComEA family DNA-binding protein [bacterium]
KLPGIGPVKAKAIIDYRESIGKFESLNEISKVKGIGKETVAKLEPYLEIVGDSAKVKSSLDSEGEKAITSKININTASLNELTLLPGIGEKKAQAIIKYREEVGDFKTKDEIKNVKGIGDGIYKKIKRKIEVK